jgi:hypothetical protein
MTGPQFREPREPPGGWLAPGLVLSVLVAGAITCLALAFLSAFGFPPRP